MARKPLLQARLSQQYARLRILQHERQTIARVSRIQRNVRTSGLQNPEQPDQHFQRALDADADENVAPDSEIPQVVRQAVGTVVELPISQLLVFEDRGDRIGCSFDLLFNQLMTTCGLWAAPAPPRSRLSNTPILQSRDREGAVVLDYFFAAVSGVLDALSRADLALAASEK